MSLIVLGLLIGVAATLVIDLWALLLKRLFGLPTPNWALVGRWVSHLPSGQVIHDDIGKAAGVPSELAVGWVFHYAVGALFGVVTVLIGGAAWAAQPTLLLPLAVGIITVGCGWFILQPGMGAGIAASRRPNRARILALNLVAHVIFGVGMYAAARILAGSA
jgi:hypothetical protein